MGIKTKNMYFQTFGKSLYSFETPYPRVCITPMFLACVFVCAHNYVNVVATNVEVIFLTLNHALNVSSRHFEILLFITIPSSPKLWRKE